MIPVNKLGWGYADPESKVFYKRVDRLKHKMKKYDGYGMDARLLKTLVEKKYHIILAELSRGQTNLYYISPDKWKEMGITDEFGDNKPQVFINEKYLKKI